MNTNTTSTEALNVSYPAAYAMCEQALCTYADWAWESKVKYALEHFGRTGLPEHMLEAYLVGWMLCNEDYSDEVPEYQGPSASDYDCDQAVEEAIESRYAGSDDLPF